MVSLKQIAKKYDLTTNDFELMYYDTFNIVKRLSGKKINEDLFIKFLSDRLEENGIGYKDTEKLIEYYSDKMQTYQSKKEEQENIEDESIEEEMQTSNNTGVDSDIGMNRKHGYKTKVINMYSDYDNEGTDD